MPALGFTRLPASDEDEEAKLSGSITSHGGTTAEVNNRSIASALRAATKRPFQVPFVLLPLLLLFIVIIYGTPYVHQSLKGIGRESALKSSTSTTNSTSTLILYAYHESEDARANFQFYLRHALHDQADFIFIFNGETEDVALVPQRPNIKIIQRNNTCYDLGAYGEVLLKNDKELRRRYSKFILMNASVRGPFVPRWSDVCWSEAYSSKITQKVKMAGMTMNCLGGKAPWIPALADKGPWRHIQSMILATDTVGIDLLLTPEGLDACHNDYNGAISTEIGLTKLITNAGYDVDAMGLGFHSEPDFTKTCELEDVWDEGNYFGENVNPFDTMFVKTKRGIQAHTLDRYTEWVDGAEYSSYDACRPKDEMRQ
ncbi:hypothetical protein T439DRAFT_327486 [Meredithblackwellia eburnea MCA 4105]